MELLNQTYVIIDFETANSNPTSICQIGMLKVKNGEIIDSFSHLIKPEPSYFSSMNISIHGIKESDVMDMPTFDSLWPKINQFIDGYELVAHFAQFDFNCLLKTLALYDIDVNLTFACSYRIAKELIEAKSHSLTYLSQVITRYTYQAHDALEDCKATHQLLDYCFKNYNVNELITSKFEYGSINLENGYSGFKYKKRK